MNESLLADTPLENPEQDRLGFAPFAKNLADAICKVTTDDCLVFALYGQWGTGKTTCLNFVLHYINEKSENERPIVVRFNPWWFSGHGELLNQFFREFCIALGKDEKYKETIELINDLLDIASEIPSIGIFGKIVKILSRKLRNYTKEKEVWRLRKEIHHNLLKQDKHILVIIDDIDRLPSDEIKSLFRVIKAVADFPKTIYLLAFDKNVVADALEYLQGKKGEDYLEKIVQVPFDLPIPDKIALRRLFLEQIDTILSDTPQELFDQTYFLNVFWDGIDYFLKTMRNVKSLTNALKVTYTSVKGEVNPADFIAIETVRIFYSNIYQLIRKNPDMFAGYSDLNLHPKLEDIKPFHNKWLEQISEKDSEVIKRLLKRIFPKLEAVFGGSHYGSIWESTWRKQLRICSPYVFPVYFRLAIPEGEISHTEMQAILTLTNDIETFGNKLLELSRQHRLDGSTRVNAFLERMEDYTEKEISFDQIPKILQVLFNLGDELLVPEDEGRGIFSWGNDIRIGRIMFQLLKRYKTQEERFDLLKDVFSNGKAVSIIVGEVITLGQQHGKYDAKTKTEEECLISVEHLEELEKITLQKIKQVVLERRLLNSPHLGKILYMWRNWEGEGPPKEWSAQAILSDEGLVDFLTGFLSKGYSHVITNHVGKVKWYLDPKSLESFIDPSEIIERCRNLLKSSPDWLNDKRRIAVETFMKSYDLQSKGKSLKYPWEWEDNDEQEK